MLRFASWSLSLILLYLAAPATAQHYKDYHTAVNRAEEFLVNGKADSALRWYRQAFAGYEFIFYKDAVNAAQVAVKNKRFAYADNFLLKGAASGLQPQCLDNIPLLQAYLRGKGHRLVDRMLRTGTAAATKRQPELAAEWQERFSEEQSAKNHPGSRASYRETVQRNVDAIRKLWTERQLFPGDRALGPGRCMDMGNVYAFYTLAHYDCSASAVEDILWPAIEAGMLHPRDAAALWEFERLRKESVPVAQRTNPGCKAQVKKFNLAWFHEKDAASLAEAAANRERYWIRTLRTDSLLKAMESPKGYRLRHGYR